MKIFLPKLDAKCALAVVAAATMLNLSELSAVPPRSVFDAANQPVGSPAPPPVPVPSELPEPPQTPAAEERSGDGPWLGVLAAEATEALAAQLNLMPGEGLVVVYVATNSPAAKAGLEKNDVLSKFEDQSLVHPAQLKKLVRMHKPGDTVHLTAYHAGKRQELSVTLEQTPTDFRAWGTGGWGEWPGLPSQFSDLHMEDAFRAQMRALRDSMGHVKIDQQKVQTEVKRSVEQARKAIEQALRGMTNAGADLAPLRRELERLARSGLSVERNATVIVQNSDKAQKNLVQSDDEGTIVLFSNPRLHLTAHDKDGKLLFDGEIESQEQKDKVPSELWSRVQPLIDKMEQKPKAEAE